MNSKTVDMTKGPVLSLLIPFMLPLIGSSIFQMLYNTVDFMFVGNFMNKTAAAAVGASSTLIAAAVGLFTGISVGTSVTAGQALGMSDEKMAERVLHTSIWLGIAGGIAIAGAGIVFAPWMLKALKTPGEVLPSALLYMRIFLISIPMQVIYNMVSGAMRAWGDSQTPFRILVICGILNVLLDILLILVIPLGVAGVAIATVAAQTVSAGLAINAVSKPESGIRFYPRKLSPDRNVIIKILKIGLPAGIQSIIITFSNIMVQYYINAFGETAMAAFAAYYKVENFLYLPILAFGQAATTFAAQNTGSLNFSRIRRGVIPISLLGSGIVVGLSAIILLMPETVFGWFMQDRGVVKEALKIAFVSFPFYWIYPVLETVGGTLRGMGHSILSMCVIILNLCVLRITLLAWFSEKFHTIQALAAVYPVTWAAASVCFMMAFAVIMKQKCKTAEA